MLGRIVALAALVALLVAGAAEAAPVSVQLRVEGSTSTIFEGPVRTDGKTIDKGDGPHPCDGTAGVGHPTPVPTMTSALDDGSIAGGFPWTGTWFGFGDFGIDSIGPDANQSLPTPEDPYGGRFWGYALNLLPAGTGGCSQEVTNGDEVLYAFDFFGTIDRPKPILRLSGPSTVAAGQPATLKVTDGGTPGEPAIGGATISGAPGPVLTGGDGRVTITFDTPGIKRLKADRTYSVRSASLAICVSGPGQVCEPAASGAVRDSRAPRATIAGLRDGQRLRRGPRLLRGTAVDETAVAQVKLALRRHHAGKPCQWWSGRREKFVGTSCDKRFFFAVGSDRNWSYLLPSRLPAGRYVLDVKAFDRARNRDERFVRGRNRVVFYVGPSKRSAKGAARRGPGAAASRARGVPVQVMVAGRERTLAPSRTVTARASYVHAGGRRCRVAAATPLAALAATLRGRAGLGLRDFGRCSDSTTAGSGQLFVYRVGPDANRGTDGWFYKVAGRAGTAGAADPAGPLGSGRLRRHSQVLWFYCLFDEGAGSCQRTLAIEAPRHVKAGSPLSVRVTGLDNDGRSRPVAGARVSIGSASALTGSDGRCTLTAPAAGRWSLQAERAGMVPSFPVRMTVR